MFEQIRFENFQAWKDLTLTLDPHATVLVGPSDSGKSSIVRGLRWICLNQPRGSEFIREGESTATVTAVVDGQTVSRQHGKQARYTLGAEEFVAFNRDVPVPIANLINVTDLNFQNQHDPVFWFSEGAAATSRNINAIVDLGVVDDLLNRVGERIRKSKTKIDIFSERLRKTKEEKKTLRWACDLDSDLQKVEGLTHAAAYHRKLQATGRHLNYLWWEMQTAAACVTLGNVAKLALEAAAIAANRAASIRERLHRVRTAAKLEPVPRMVADFQRVADLRQRATQATEAAYNARQTIKRVNSGQHAVRHAKAELDRLTAEATAAAPKTCPTCQRPL